MSRIVFAWELGNSRGHLCRLIPIARRLAASGHTVYLVTKDLVLARQLAGDASLIALPCPAQETPLPLGRDPASYSDVLAMYGFGDVAVFQALSRSWQDIFAMTGADMLIAEHAPLALISARLAGLPAVHVGDGFTVPPLTAPLPEFRMQDGAACAARIALEAAMLGMVNQCLQQAGKAACRILAQAFQGDVTLLATIPELDPYYSLRQPQAHFIGKIRYADAAIQPGWLSHSQPRIFLYLNAREPLGHVLDALAAAPVETIAVVPGIPGAVARRYAGHARLRLHQAFVDMSAALPDCDLLIAHGGQGITLDSLRYGVPLLLLPCHVEQLLTTECIARADAGLGILPDYIEERFSDVLTALLTDRRYRLGAQALQRKYWTDAEYCASDAAMMHIEGAIGATPETSA